MKNVCVIGDGILGATTCLELAKMGCKITWVTRGRKGAATPAAAAMLNSFAEIDNFTFRSKFSSTMFEVSMESTLRWPSLYSEVSDFCLRQGSFELPPLGMGTHVINNTASDNYEDSNFELLMASLKKFKQQHTFSSGTSNQLLKNGYFPEDRFRALRSVFIKNEGFFNPKAFLEAIDRYLVSEWSVETLKENVIGLKSEGDGIVVRFESFDKKFDKVINCAGAWSESIKEMIELPKTWTPRLFSGVGVSLELKADIDGFEHCIRTPNRGGACGIYVVPQVAPEHKSNSFIVGASNMMSLHPQFEPKAAAVSHLINAAASEINVHFEDATIASINTGNRPITSDLYPLMGRYGETSVYSLTGTRRDGLHCAPVLSHEIAHLVVNGTYAKFDLEFCNPLREPILDISRESSIKENVAALLSEWFQHGFSVASHKQIGDFSNKLRSETENILDRYQLGNKGLHPHILKLASKGVSPW